MHNKKEGKLFIGWKQLLFSLWNFVVIIFQNRKEHLWAHAFNKMYRLSLSHTELIDGIIHKLCPALVYHKSTFSVRKKSYTCFDLNKNFVGWYEFKIHSFHDGLKARNIRFLKTINYKTTQKFNYKKS